MAIELKMPALSPTMESGTLSKWLVKEGDEVKAGDLLAEIETDKATMEFEAADEGTVAKLLVAAGTDEVKVGQVIALLAEEGEDVGEAASASNGAAAAPAAAPAPAAKPAAQADGGQQRAPDGAPPAGVKGYGAQPDKDAGLAGQGASSPAGAASGGAGQAEGHAGGRVKASPLARRLAAQQSIELSALSGSGPGGRIVKADVLSAAEGQPAAAAEASVAKAPREQAAPAAPAPAAPTPAAPPADAPFEAIKLSNMRKVIARRLTEAKQQVPHIYLTVDVRLDPLLKLRKELNESLKSQLSINDFLIKALAVALRQVPGANVQYAGDQLYKFSRVDMSVAVALPDGLITPIIRDADGKRLTQISSEMRELAGRAREGKLKPEEFQGGTASLSNLGMFGIKHFDAVINPPQGMILAVGAGEKRPYVVDDALSVATVMTVTGSFDHRAIDGAVGAELMAAFKTLVEQPLAMLA